jgi:hypothetical protein
MKRVSCMAICVLLSFIWIPLVSAGTNNSLPTQVQQGQERTSVQNGQFLQPNVRTGLPWQEKGTMQRESEIMTDPIIPPRAGISWKEKVMRERAIHNRAEASRNALLRQAALDRQNKSKSIIRQESPVMP